MFFIVKLVSLLKTEGKLKKNKKTNLMVLLPQYVNYIKC